jgi:hypothetical protein
MPTTDMISGQTTVEFPPVYYNAPVSRPVEVSLGESGADLQAELTSGAPYFKILSKKVVAPSGWPDGKQPVEKGQGQQPPPLPYTAQVTVVAEVPKGASLARGPFTATLVITGLRSKATVTLKATLYGTIIGKMSITPATVVPGQPVQIEVLDTFGKPISDPAVSVTVQGVPGNSRWEQYATAGTRTLCAVASNGTITETATTDHLSAQRLLGVDDRPQPRAAGDPDLERGDRTDERRDQRRLLVR